MREIFIMYTIQRITEENKSDIHLLNEPFKIWGRMTPLFDGKAWSYQTKELPQEKQYEMCFPDFEIGGFNTQVYKGTKQEGKSDIYFYLNIE